MDINLEDGVKSLPKKYELNDSKDKKEILDKITSFLNDNKMIKIYYDEYDEFNGKNDFKILNNDFITFSTDIDRLRNYAVVEIEDGSRAIYKVGFNHLSEVTTSDYLTELKFIYNAYVKNVCDYRNLFIRFNNLKMECTKHGEVFLIDNDSKAISGICIKNLSFNTITNKISFDDFNFSFSKEYLVLHKSNEMNVVNQNLENCINYLKFQLNKTAVSEKELKTLIDKISDEKSQSIKNSVEETKKTLFDIR